jgi:hypothetical protein
MVNSVEMGAGLQFFNLLQRRNSGLKGLLLPCFKGIGCIYETV